MENRHYRASTLLTNHEVHLQTLAKHREKERYRHRGLNAVIEYLANRVPGLDLYPFCKTKMVKLQLVIDYIRTLEEAVDSLCNQLDVNVTSDYSFITKSSSNYSKKTSKKSGSMLTKFTNDCQDPFENEKESCQGVKDDNCIPSFMSGRGFKKTDHFSQLINHMNGSHDLATNSSDDQLNVNGNYMSDLMTFSGSFCGETDLPPVRQKIVITKMNYQKNNSKNTTNGFKSEAKIKIEDADYIDMILNLGHVQNGQSEDQKSCDGAILNEAITEVNRLALGIKEEKSGDIFDCYSKPAVSLYCDEKVPLKMEWDQVNDSQIKIKCADDEKTAF